MNGNTENLVTQLQAYDARKRDVVAKASAIEYGGGRFHFDGESVRATGTAVRQLCTHAGIPTDFFLNTMTPAERSVIFNRLNLAKGDTERLFRFSGDALYGFVSPKYRKLDNIRLIGILEAADDAGLSLKPVKFTLDPDHTKVKLVPVDAQVGELAPMIEFTNSETGLGSLQVWAGVYRFACTNGMMIPVADVTRSRWIHMGALDIQLPDLFVGGITTM